MPTPPPVAAVRARLDLKNADGFLAGSRLFFSYAGSAPTAANCTTLATDIGSQWATHIMVSLTTEWSLYEVDVLDLGSSSGASGQDTTIHAGASSPPTVQTQTAMNVEFNIARRYRGGKPRIYIPGLQASDLADDAHWSSATLTAINTNFAAFIAAIEALSIGAMGALQHVNISFFHGKNTSSPPWRGPGYKYPPAYRATPLVDNISGYSAKAVVGSQKRRRTATTP